MKRKNETLEALRLLLVVVVALVVVVLLAVRSYNTGADIGMNWALLLGALLGSGHGLHNVLKKKGEGENANSAMVGPSEEGNPDPTGGLAPAGGGVDQP